MIISANTSLVDAAREITSNSEYFNDEVDSVISYLSDLVKDAEKFGCSFTREIHTMWGGSETVTAIPSVRRNSWSF